MAEKSIFTKIIEGEIPSHKIYEDDIVLAFLDIYPAVSGQTVIVSKKQVPTVWELSEVEYRGLLNAAKKIAAHYKKVLGTKYVGLKIEGVDVAHAHVKIYPFNTVEEYNAKQDMDAEPDHTALAAMADKLKMKDE